jgi:neurotransmitter:Na+ symporter, NSS family
MNDPAGATRENWGSYSGFVFAAIASAVGIGNIWRFPYIVGENGGGAFLITYLIIIFTFGLSFMTLELAVGRYYKTSIITALSNIRKKFKWVGALIVSVTFVLASYYMIVIGWILSFFVITVLGLDTSFDEYTSSFYPVLSFFAVVIINYLIIKLGVREGIEKISKIGVILLIGIMIPLSIIGMTLEGAENGINFYLSADFSKLDNPNVWYVAFGQVFFSLSIGMGVLLTYGSYINDKHSIIRSSVIIIVADLIIAFIAGLMIFSFVFSIGMDPTEGVSLVFKVLPTVFSNMAFGIIIGGLFFFLLMLAGVTSSIGMLQISVSVLEENFKLSRSKASRLVTIISTIIGLPLALSYSSVDLTVSSMPLFDIFDMLISEFGLTISATLFIIVILWFMDRKKIMEQVNLHSKITIPVWIFQVVKYLIPILLVSTLVMKLFDFLF